MAHVNNCVGCNWMCGCCEGWSHVQIKFLQRCNCMGCIVVLNPWWGQRARVVELEIGFDKVTKASLTYPKHVSNVALYTGIGDVPKSSLPAMSQARLKTLSHKFLGSTMHVPVCYVPYMSQTMSQNFDLWEGSHKC